MAEPARQHYEPDEEEEQNLDNQPFLRSVPTGGKSEGETHRGNLQSVKDVEANSNSPEELDAKENTPSRKTSSGNTLSLVPGGLSTAEAGNNDIKFSGGATGTEDADNSVSKVRSFASRNRRNLLIGGGAGGGLLALLFVGFFLLIPLKIESIVNDLQNKFFSSSENAISNEENTLFRRYVEKYVAPSLKSGCKITIDSGCTVNIIGNGKNPITNLYKTWKQAKIESVLKEKYGIEIRYDKLSNTYFIKTPNTATEKDIGEGSIDDTEFQAFDRAGARQAISDGLDQSTESVSMLFRYQVGALEDEKFGIKRCIFFCNGKDALSDIVPDQKIAAKLVLADRVIAPRDQLLGQAMRCLLTSCDPTKVASTECTPGVNCEMNDAPESATEVADDQALESLEATLGTEDARTLESLLADMQKNGTQKYIVQFIFKNVFNIEISDETAQTLSDAIPLLGWIRLANTLNNTVQEGTRIGPAIKKLSYITNAAAAVQLYMTYRTYADEVHTGNVNANEVGSMVDSLSPGNTGPPSDPIVGGTAGAEQTPLYGDLLDNNPNASGSSSYTCSNGGQVPAGQLVCPEEVLGGGNSIANAISSTLKAYPYIITLSHIWSDTVGAVFNLAGNTISFVAQPIVDGMNLYCNGAKFIPFLGTILSILGSAGYCAVGDLFRQVTPPIINAITSELIPNPFGSNMSGGRTFDMMAAGADVAGNDYAHNGLGGEVLTPSQVAENDSEQEADAKAQFDRQPLFARIFSTDSQYSLVSQLAMDVPINNVTGTVQNSAASLFSLAPLKAFASSFSSIFSKRVDAQAAPATDPFGVTQYGYQDSDPIFTADPEDYWNQNCSDGADGALTQAWNTTAANNSNNGFVDVDGMPENTTTDPCLLLQAAVGAAGGYFDTSNLTQDDLASVGLQ